MRIATFSCIVGLILCAGSPARAEEPVTVLGLPLGGKFKMPIRQCEIRELGKDVRSLCWVDRPYVTGGVRLGSISVPGADTRPKWAAFASFDAHVEKDGTLSKLGVQTFSDGAFDEIVSSISSRFGKPSDFSTGPTTKGATWNRQDIHIRMYCGYRGCQVEFQSPAYYAQLQRELAARKAKDAARAISP